MGQSNFSMDRTSLIFGGFTQPIIEGQGGSQKGFCQRFMWVFPKPIFGHLDTLTTTNDQDLSKLMG